MKNVILLIALALATAAAAQNTLTVCKYCPAQFREVKHAVDEAKDGDIIIVSGYYNPIYESVTINKRITLIGESAVSNTESNNVCVLPTVTLEPSASSKSTGVTSISGFEIWTLTTSGSAQDKPISNIVLKRNTIERIKHNDGYLSNWIIQNNVIKSILHGKDRQIGSGTSGGRRDNFIIANNVIRVGIGYGFSEDNSRNIRIINNLFADEYEPSEPTPNYLYDMSGVVFVNNIFLRHKDQVDKSICVDVTKCIFNNNILASDTYIFHESTTSLDPFLANGNEGRDNKVGDPKFTKFEKKVWGTNNWYEGNLTLAENSPGKKAGADGTDIGILGGSTPMPISTSETISLSPAIPKVQRMDVRNAHLSGGQKLNVNIETRPSN